MEKINVLFVCMGNICRSPTAQGVFTNTVVSCGLQERIHIDSAGTHAYHIGESPDARSQVAALERNIDLSSQRARQVKEVDFERFHYVLAMDEGNLSTLKRQAKAGQQGRIQLFMGFAERWNEREVPDPYYGGDRGFERVLDMVEDAAEGLLRHLVQQHQLK
ncbi:MAG: low molecular weight protein-tyrosine-phosphatase [Thiolinea sp.]